MRDHRLVRLGEGVERSLHAFDQVGRMRQTVVFCIDLFPFTRLRGELVEFGQLPREPLSLELQFAVARFGCFDRLCPVAPGAPGAAHRGSLVDQSCVRIEQLTLRIRAHQ
jgi:hypothetical protein